MTETGSIEITAGRLLWREIRDAVSEAKFNGMQAELWESSGWLERRFVVRGDVRLLRAVARWISEVEAAQGASKDRQQAKE